MCDGCTLIHAIIFHNPPSISSHSAFCLCWHSLYMHKGMATESAAPEHCKAPQCTHRRHTASCARHTQRLSQHASGALILLSRTWSAQGRTSRQASFGLQIFHRDRTVSSRKSSPTPPTKMYESAFDPVQRIATKWVPARIATVT